MLSQDEQIALFVDAINKNALKMRREIEKDTKKLYLEETQKLEGAAKKELGEKIVYAEKETTALFSKKSAALKAEYRQRLCKRREELTEQIFTEAQKRLTSFVSSSQYNAFLEKSIENICALLKSDIIFYAKNGDCEAVKAVAEKHCTSFSVEADKSIAIGGVKAFGESERKIIDDTLDERLSQQRDIFLSLAGKELSIQGG